MHWCWLAPPLTALPPSPRAQAQLRLPAAWPLAKKIEIVAYVIKLLGLEDVLDSIIGNPEVRGISGGQRKRVNIGMELVADPTFLALDEPTSGLDSTSSLKVVAALKAVATDQHLTVVAVIHQPRSVSRFAPA